MRTQFVDIHIHPAMKPLGKSYNRQPGVNHPHRNRTDSIWHADPPTLLDKALNIFLTLTKFRQSDFTSLAEGGACVVFVSLCGLEKSFVMTKMGTRLPGDVLNDLVIGLGKKRIDHIQKMKDYFADLELEYNYYLQLDGHRVKIDKQWFEYRIVSGSREIINDPKAEVQTIYVILTIEGTHVFNTGLQMMGRKANPDEVLENIDKVKNWDKRLFLIGLTHHFYNEMVGHAQSLSGVAAKMCDQSEGMNEGINELGWKVVRKLLDNSNGRRVLIDLKHMSIRSREEYYQFLEAEYPGEQIPLVVSHGAVNGFRSHTERIEDDLYTAGMFQQTDINFFDDELVRIARLGGLFGIQFDERRLGSLSEVKASGMNLNRRKMLFRKSKLVWNQIQHTASVLDHHGLFAWGIQCIGTDNDGMVNPLSGFWTAAEMPLFESYLEKHAYNFLKSEQAAGLHDFNRLKSDEVIELFMKGNAMAFLEKHF